MFMVTISINSGCGDPVNPITPQNSKSKISGKSIAPVAPGAHMGQ